MIESQVPVLARDAQLLAILGLRPTHSAPRSELHDGWLRVHFGAGAPAHADFHLRWLRHHGDRARTADPPDRIEVLSSYVDAEDRLHVQWKEIYTERRVELSEQVFPLAWLRANAYAADRAGAPPPAAALAFVEVDARRVGPHWALREFCLDRLHREGAIVVRAFGRDTEGLIQLLEQAGLAVAEAGADGDSSGAGLRTDHPHVARPPRYRLRHCLRASAQRHELRLVDARRAAEHLRSIDAETFELLRSVAVRFAHGEQTIEAPILSLGERGLTVRYGPFALAPSRVRFDRMEAFYRAHDRFVRLVGARAHQLRFELRPGDFVLHDNHRMLHAAIGATGDASVRTIAFDAEKEATT
jgi:gamma-butyrobetaine dioxygenase/trimethyllysine dioxygenase